MKSRAKMLAQIFIKGIMFGSTFLKGGNER
jgi:hypothetical protein